MRSGAEDTHSPRREDRAEMSQNLVWVIDWNRKRRGADLKRLPVALACIPGPLASAC